MTIAARICGAKMANNLKPGGLIRTSFEKTMPRAFVHEWNNTQAKIFFVSL